MKRILYLHAGAEMYGADKVLLELLGGLDKSKFEPHVLLPNDGPLVEEFKKSGIKVGVVEYPILRRKYFNPKGILDYALSYKRFSRELLEYARLHQIDLIHNNTTAVLEGIYLKKFLKKPLIWHVHEIIVKPKLIATVINFLMGQFADKIITVSNAVSDHVSASKFVSKEQLKTIYNGVDSDTYYPYTHEQRVALKNSLNMSSSAILVGMIGRVNAWKGQGDFLEAMMPLLEKYPHLHLMLVGGVFAGEEWRMEELQKAVAQSEYSERIILKDFQEETVPLYNVFDIFVLPSTNPDPLPTVVLEAMACGKPVVGYRHGGVLEMVEENGNGLFANVGQPKDLSDKIEQLLNDPELMAQFGNQSRWRLQNLFSKQAYIDNFTRLYEKW